MTRPTRTRLARDPLPRKPLHSFEVGGERWVLCGDGSAWLLRDGAWIEQAPIPGSWRAAVKPREDAQAARLAEYEADRLAGIAACEASSRAAAEKVRRERAERADLTARMRESMAARGLAVEEIAESLGYAPSTVTHALGVSPSATRTSVRRVAAFLGVSIDDAPAVAGAA